MFSEDDYVNRTELPLDSIYVDTREGNRYQRFAEYMRKKLEKTKIDDDYWRVTTSSNRYFLYKSVEQCDLLNGDFCYNGTVFEFKTYTDLLDSIKNERLDKQIDNILKDPAINQYFIISPCLNEFDFKGNFRDCVNFEDEIKNYFHQFIPFNIHFIPAVSEQYAFRDMINIWSAGQHPYNLFVLNNKYRVNAFLNTLAALPAVNHNDAMAIFKEYPFYTVDDVLKLTVDMLSNVKFGRKKRIGQVKAEKIKRQIDAVFPNLIRQQNSLKNIYGRIKNLEGGEVID